MPYLHLNASQGNHKIRRSSDKTSSFRDTNYELSNNAKFDAVPVSRTAVSTRGSVFSRFTSYDKFMQKCARVKKVKFSNSYVTLRGTVDPEISDIINERGLYFHPFFVEV